MSEISEDIRQKLMHILKEEEENTDLKNLAVLSRVGLKVASAVSSELDADTISASSTALIDLGLRLSDATHHGGLREILLHNSAGYSILMAINDEYIIFGGLSSVLRIGYYLGYMRELTFQLNRMISGDTETKMALSLDKSQRSKKAVQEETKIIKPSVEQDKAALNDLLGFLDEWEQEEEVFEDLEVRAPNNIVGIPKAVGATVTPSAPAVGLPKKPVSPKREFMVYSDEVPPIPLDDYTPMEMEEESSPTTATPTQPVSSQSPDELPSFEELEPPDFAGQVDASEYDTNFILKEESEALDSVLKDLGWDEEKD